MRNRLPASIATSVLVAALALGLPSASARRSDDPRAEREQVRARQAQVASDLDVLKADQAKLEEALRLLNDNVTMQEGLKVEADRAATAAEEARVAADEAVKGTEEELEVLKEE